MTGPSVNNNYDNILAELGWPIKNGELSSQLAGQQWVKSLKGLFQDILHDNENKSKQIKAKVIHNTVDYLIMHNISSMILLCIIRSYALLDHYLAGGWEVGAPKVYALWDSQLYSENKIESNSKIKKKIKRKSKIKVKLKIKLKNQK
jgi:hypothetical protein